MNARHEPQIQDVLSSSTCSSLLPPRLTSPTLTDSITDHNNMSRSFKAELAEEVAELSPTIPNSSNRTQTVDSTTPAHVSQNTPIDTPASMADSDATMANGDHDAMRNLGADSYQLIKVIKKLEDLNIDATLPSLPKFVVVGDQSAGKSSVVEALCDISLPRGQGTCTR